jgi:hypothetical protein
VAMWCVQCDRFSETLVEPLATLLHEHFAPAESMLHDRLKAIKRAEDAQAALEKATGTAQAVQAKRLAALDAAQAAVNADAMAQSAMVRAAHQREADLKGLLSEYVRGQMLYHCRALEGLSRASEIVEGIELGVSAREMEAEILKSATDSSVLVLGKDARQVVRPTLTATAATSAASRSEESADAEEEGEEPEAKQDDHPSA